MKKIAFTLMILFGLLLLPSSLAAQQPDWDGLYHKGDFAMEIGLGFGAHGAPAGYSLAAFPGIEWIFADFKIADTVPLAVGLAGKGLVEFAFGYGLGFGAGGFAAAHMGFAGLDTSEFVQNLDVYVGAGVGLLFVSWEDPSLGLSVPMIYSGAAWYFRETLAAYVEFNGWFSGRVPGYKGVVAGLRMRGKPKDLRGSS